MFEALRFLLLAEVLGLIAMPLAATVLGRLPGSGLGFAKPLGVLLAVWLVWVLGSAGIPYGLPLGVAAVAALGLVSARVARLQRGAAKRDRLRRPLAWWSEGVFVVSFAAMALLSAFSPDVWGTEKPMDMAIVNALNASTGFPPHDPWLAGADLDGYYYLGHLVAAFFIRLTGVEPTAGYNLALAVTYALAATAVFSLAAALAAAAGRAAVRTGLAAVALCLVLGNLAAAKLLLELDGPLRQYPWFEASRVIPDTINEFPLFSWTLGDLHAHVVVLPFTVLVLAFALQLLLAGLGRAGVVAGGIATGVLYAMNSWSYPVAAGLLAFAAAARTRHLADRAERRRAAAAGAALLVVSIVAILPFLLAFRPPATGIGFVRQRIGFAAFADDLFLLYGLLLWLLAAAFYAAVRGSAHPLRNLSWSTAALAFAGAALAGADLTGVVLLAALIAVALHRLLGAGTAAPDRFVWLLIAGGLTCIAIPEVVYVRDAFADGEFARMNTVFKFGFQAWVLLAVAGAACVPWSRVWLPRAVRGGWLAVAAGLAVASLAFPVAGVYARKAGFSDGPRLNGMGWLPAGDVAAIEWLRANAPGDAVVLESAGDDYSAFGHARISTYTGRATVIGWAGHVLQWGHDPDARRTDVDTLYRTTDPAQARVLLDVYGIGFVVVGPLELADHGDAGTRKWESLGRRVLDRAGTTVWRVSR